MSHQTTHTDDGFLNDFHREWNAHCMVERERTKSMRFTHEYLKAASLRMNELVRKEEERLRDERGRF